MIIENKHIRQLVYPKLILNNQDKTDEFGYHWVETNASESNKIQICMKLKSDNNYNYYLALKSPYEIYKKHNVPSNYLGSYVVRYTEEECKALTNLIQPDLFMPTIEFIKSIDAKTWVECYLEIIAAYPEKINSLYNYSFWVLYDEEKYKNFYLKCYPFLDLRHDVDMYGNDLYFYKNGDIWLDHTFYRKDNNIVLLDRTYQSPYTLSSGVIPVIKTKLD